MDEGKMFDGVNYYIVESNVKNPTDVSCIYLIGARRGSEIDYGLFFFQVKQILKEGGASREFYMSELVTHVISDVPVDSDTLAVKGQDHVTDHVTVHVGYIVTQRVR